MELLEKAREILRAGEEFTLEEQEDVLLTAIGFKGEECVAQVIAPEAGATSLTKDIFCQMLRLEFARKGADSCFIIMPAYRLKVEKIEDYPGDLSEDPRSEEMITVAAHNTLGETLYLSKLVKRETQNPESRVLGFGEEEVAYGASGRFLEILPAMRPAQGHGWQEN